MRWLLLASLSLVLACSTDATPKNKPVAAPAVAEKRPVEREAPPEESLPQMTAAPTFSAVAAGSAQSCGVTEGADLFCWGSNDRGQLAGSAADATVPSPVAGSARFIALSSGAAHSCALSTDHLVYCWGSNGNGQLGTGSHKRNFEPAKLMFGIADHP